MRSINEIRTEIKNALTKMRLAYKAGQLKLTAELKATVLAALHQTIGLSGAVKDLMAQCQFNVDDLFRWQNEPSVMAHRKILLSGILADA